jgi:hypothetical protein
VDWWEGKAEIAPGCPIIVHVSPDPESGDVSIGEARQTFLRARAAEPAHRRAAARWLLEVYNGFWNPGKRDMSAAAFAKRISPEAVELRADGTAKLYYADGGLFRGHGIEVHIRADGSVERAGLAG